MNRRHEEDWQARERKMWEHSECAPNTGQDTAAELATSRTSTNARYIELRRTGLTADESLSAITDERGVKRSQVLCPAWDEDNGTLEDLLAAVADGDIDV